MRRGLSLLKHFIINSLNIFIWALRFVLYGTFNKPRPSPKNHQIFILGNGPSLIKDIEEHIDTLKQKDILMVNGALSSDLAFKLKPKFYCLMDPAYWCLNTDNQYEKNKLQEEIRVLECAIQQVDWEMTIFAPNQFYKKRNSLSIQISNPFVKIATFNALELHTFRKIEYRLFSQGYAIPSGINVLITSLCCAIAMKYKKIYLLGADSDWNKQMSVDNLNRLYFEHTYYYDSNNRSFSPYNVSYFYRCFLQTFLAYDRLAELNFPIYNLSSNSMIDSFPRKNIADVIK